MRHILFLLFMALTLQAIAQYPATGNKARLGWQTTGDGLVYRGAIGDTATLDPSGLNNAWMLLDTANGNLYAYRAKAWRLVSGGGGGGLTMPFDSVTFNVNETDASQRELKYSEEKGYLQYGGLDSVQIPLLPGIWYVRNDTSVTIPKGTVVRATGTLGASGRIKVKHMIANGTIDAMYVLGIAMQDIAVGADGYVMTQGKIRQVNTQAYSEGAVLYADVDTLGGLTQTEPTGSNLKLPIAFVVYSASNGTLAVRVSPGTYLRDLHDAYITSPESNASLYYNTSESVWRDTTGAVLTSDTSVFARDFQISGTANYLAKFTGSNAVGNSGVFESAGNVGIGTASPGSYLLNLRDSIGFSGNGMYFSSTNGSTANPGGYIIGTKLGSWGTRLDIWLRDAGGSLTERAVSITGGGGSGGSIGINTITPSRPLHVNATSAIRIPVGTTAQRPSDGANGDIRYNTTNANFEWYSGTGWREPVNAARSPAAGLANRFSKFDANGLLDTSAILIQANNRIGIFNSPAAGDSALTVTGGIRATRDMYARRYNVNTFSNEVLSINNYAPANMINGRNVWIGDGGQASQHTSGQTGGYNVSLGAEALLKNTTGFGNIAIASQALAENTTGFANVAIGGAALSQNKTGAYNVSVGSNSCFYCVSDANTAVGYGALQNYTQVSGGGNTAIGFTAQYEKTTGTNDVAIGVFAGRFISNTWGTSVTSSNKNVFIGAECYPNGDGQTGQIVIGYGAIGNGSNTTTIGNSSTTATIFQYGETRLGMAVDSGEYTLQVNGNTKLIGNLARKKPVTIAAATYTVLSDDSWLICNHTAQITITLPTAANSIGRELMIKYVAGGGATVISNATNVSPIVGGALTNIILPATAGSWVTLVCDGANWIIMQKG